MNKRLLIAMVLLLALMLAGNVWALGPYTIQAGATSQEITIDIADSTDGTAETGVTYDSIDALWYRRAGTNDQVSITPATLAAKTTAWSSGGFIHIGDGAYRLDVPNAALVAGSPHVTIGGNESDMVVFKVTINLVGYDPTSALSTHTAANVVDNFETQSQADPTGFHVNVLEVNGTAQTANDNGADINAILVDTGTTIPATLATAAEGLEGY